MPIFSRRSIFARLARNAILVSVVAVLLLGAVTFATVNEAMRRSLDSNTATDLAGLVDIYASGGEEELLLRLADRSEVEGIEGRQSHYMLANSRGEWLIGDIDEWPQLNAALSDRGYITLPGGFDVYARSARIGPDLDLMVAREYEEESADLRRLILIFLAAGLLVIAVVALIARLTSRKLARRVARINASFRNPPADEEAVLPDMPKVPDEIDELAAHSSVSLARQARLARLHKHMSDNVAHEIRTPLLHLDQRLVSALATSPEPGGAGPLTKARTDIRGITALLDSLLDIAAAEARRGDRKGLTEIDLSKLVAEIANLYEGSFEDAGLTLKTSITSSVHFEAERMQLTRMISNLLDNAIKYVPAGGTVRLELYRGPRIVVADDGPGIPPDDRERIFSRFSRSGEEGSAAGHGLGLSLARAIAERHGLELRLEESDIGACFIVEPAT
jgi:signal transduction histidine kinase